MLDATCQLVHHDKTNGRRALAEEVPGHNGRRGRESREKITVLVVDDHPVVRDGICSMLGQDPGVKVIGTAGDGQGAIVKANELNPDVILMDIKMPGISGIEATQKIKQSRPNCAIIVFTVYDSELHVVEALRAGASGYLVKDSPPELLSDAIRAVACGAAMVKSGLLRRAVQRAFPGMSNNGSWFAEKLTTREIEVLKLLGRGYDNRRISAELVLAEITVKKYVQTIMNKLRVPNRTNAAISALRMGLVE